MSLSYLFILCCVAMHRELCYFVTVVKGSDCTCMELSLLMDPLSSSQTMHEWIWSSGELILTWNNLSPNTTLPTTNTTRTVLGANSCLCGGKMATNRLSCGTAKHKSPRYYRLTVAILMAQCNRQQCLYDCGTWSLPLKERTWSGSYRTMS